ncbi:MAG TPA: M23 family metallopeptidase [Tepidiformaceae bacterium]|nr:M23 family metallopeptidase [Tepidiformaceae bacterium]
MRRRAFLGVLLAAPLLVEVPRRVFAPGGRDGEAQAQQVPTGPVAGPRRLPQLAADGPALRYGLSKYEAFQAGAVRAWVDNAVSGSVSVLGRTYPMEAIPGGIEGFVGFGTQDPVGLTPVVISYVDLLGQAGSVRYDLRVLRTQWTVYYFTPGELDADDPPPDPNAPPPPPDEGPLLPGLYAMRTPRKWSGAWQAPLDGALDVTGYFGEQRSFNGGPPSGHHGGTDLGAPTGTPVRPANAGTVVLAGRYLVRGNLVVIDHGGGVLSLYGHMNELAVVTGQPVSKNQVIGYVGSTGLSSGPHLHWELSVAGVLVDGLRWLDGSQGF